GEPEPSMPAPASAEERFGEHASDESRIGQEPAPCAELLLLVGGEELEHELRSGSPAGLHQEVAEDRDVEIRNALMQSCGAGAAEVSPGRPLPMGEAGERRLDDRPAEDGRRLGPALAGETLGPEDAAAP